MLRSLRLALFWVNQARSTLMTLNRSIARVLTLVLMTTSITVAQNKRVLSTADYDRATKMLAPSLNGLVVGGNAQATWLADGRFWYVRTTLSGTENVIIDPVNKTRDVVATPPTTGQGAAGANGGRGG